MPSERFFKLPDEKRNKIHNAAMHEFSTMPMEHISINRIVQEAGISRGSFYTYFEDKQDVLRYLMQESHARENAYIRQCLIDTKGDIWKTSDLSLQYALNALRERNIFDLSKNVALRDGFNPLNEIRRMQAEAKPCEEDPLGSLAAFFWEHADKRRLNIPDLETMQALVFQCRVTVMTTVTKILLLPEQKEKALRLYHNTIKILQEGVLKK